jgi:hypothetical protein
MALSRDPSFLARRGLALVRSSASVNDAVSRIAQVLPLYLMGFNGAALAAFVPS